jgi:hypothetical protein
MRQIIFTLLIFSFCSCQNPKEETTSELKESNNSVSKGNEGELRNLIKKSDIHFAENWILEKNSLEEIDHFKQGRVVSWTNTENNVKYVRSYVFELDSQFVRAYEQRFINDTLLSQGGIEFKNKEINYISQVIINKQSLKKVNSYWEYDVDGYFYEIYEGGKLSCIYRTIPLNHYYMLLEKSNKDKIELTKGNDCLGIKK